jgi:hypothetical protein
MLGTCTAGSNPSFTLTNGTLTTSGAYAGARFAPDFSQYLASSLSGLAPLEHGQYWGFGLTAINPPSSTITLQPQPCPRLV